MIKIRQTLTILLASGLLLFSSCLKDDPNHPNTTYLYGHQDIPNINYYMPVALLDTLSPAVSYFGDNPPELLLDSTYICYSKDTTFYFAFSDVCHSITNLDFKMRTDDEFERSNTEKTYNFMKTKKNWEDFLNDSLSPVFFNDSTLDPEVLRHAYLIGKDSDFILYYYEIRETEKKYQPLNAVIFSGTLHTDYQTFPIDTIQANDSVVFESIPVDRYILNANWGVQTMRYYPVNNNAQTALEAELDAGTQPAPGQIITKTIDTLRINPY